MNEPKITPLARRLAEENSIDWRQLQGTGPEGTVVERDILGFLAKVMAGEVTLPPAPEEVPQAGPGAVANLAQAQAALQREGVQLGDLMPAAPANTLADDSLLDDLEFDIDLDLDEPSLAPEDAPAAARVMELPPMPAAPAANLDWDAKPAPAPSTLPTLPDLEPPAPPPPAPALIWETQEVVSPIPSFAPPAPPAMPELPEIAEPELPSLELEVPSAGELVLPSLDPTPEPQPAAPVVAESQPVLPEPVLEAEPEPALALESEPAPALEPEPVIPPAPAAAPVVAAASGLGAAPVEAPAAAPRMFHVQAWQRTVEVRAAQEAAHTLGEAWRMNVGLYPLLYRAVDRALADTQTSLRATKGILQGEELVSLRVSASQSLRGVLDSLQMASDPAEGLVVLSLADTAFDQVIFPGLSTVILGRVKDDYATLSLSAEMDARHAGALLERISYYLERPILLV
ncbi:MAG: E3 binding domain-containing protein [Meiothermus sp.]|nr:E3 binding domain-containing protein [Meiothermus sp.]